MSELDELRTQLMRFRFLVMILLGSLFITMLLLAAAVFLKGRESNGGILEGRVLILRDSRGTIRVELGVDESQGSISRLRLFDENGKGRVVAIATASEAMVGVTSADLARTSVLTEEYVALAHRQSERKAVLSVQHGPTLGLRSDSGTMDVNLVVGPTSGGLRIRNRTGNAERSISVVDENDGQSHVSFNIGEVPRLYLGLDRNSIPLLHTRTPDGEIDQQLLPRVKP